MKKNKLFVGDCDISVAQTAKQFDSDAVLINSNNYEYFLNTCNKFTGYTSVADLPKDLSIFYNLLNTVDSIKYCPPKFWSDGKVADLKDITSSIQGITEFYLYAVNKIKNNVDG